MKVLITGGYGFIGSHAVDRFYKEGCEVFIIDNLSTGNKDNVKGKHRAYCIDVTDEKCEEIFKTNMFDVVIHFAAQIDVKTSVEKPALDTRSNILGLVNMLDLSSKYGVKKFVFASSAAVYGEADQVPLSENLECIPLSPYGINKFSGEFYCKKWNEIYGLNTVCFRFSNVYGPRQGTKGEGGVISIFVEKLIRGENLTVYGDGLQTRDFIYVEDLVDAIFKASNTECGGVYNLSTNTEISLKKLIAVINKYKEVREVLYLETRKGDIARSSLDNTRIKKALNWEPKYSFEQGLGRTIKWFMEYDSQKKVSDIGRFDNLKKRLHLLLPYIENVGVFLIVAVLTGLTSSTISNSNVFSIDFRLLYILIFGVAYGMRQALISATLSSLLFMYIFLSNNNYDFLLFMIRQNNILQIASYIFIGIVAGYFAGKSAREISRKNAALENTREKLDFVQRVYNETLNTKNQMLNQIRNSENSLGKMHYMLKKLDSMGLSDIFTSSVELIEQVMKTEEVSIYSLDNEGSVLRLQAYSKSMEGNLPESIEINQKSKYKEVIISKRILVNKKLNANYPWMMAPIIYKGETRALISIHSMSFEKILTHNENLFRIVADLVSRSFTLAIDNKAQKYQNSELDESQSYSSELIAALKLTS